MVFNKKKVSEFTICAMELIAKELSKSRLKYICTFLYNTLAPTIYYVNLSIFWDSMQSRMYGWLKCFRTNRLSSETKVQLHLLRDYYLRVQNICSELSSDFVHTICILHLKRKFVD